MKKLAVCAIGLVLLVSTCLGERQFGDAHYLKPPPSGQKKAEPVKGSLIFDGAKRELSFTSKAATELTIKYDAIKNIVYERSAKPRYAAGLLLAWPLLFTKSKNHFLTFQHADSAGNGQYAIIRLDKSNYREALAVAEAETGKKVERSEER